MAQNTSPSTLMSNSIPSSCSCPPEVEETLPSNAVTMKRSVSFDYIEIREYSRCLGNSPATTHGPSLSIDWDYSEARTFKLEDYEKSRPPRRGSLQMLVPGSLRETIIMEQTDATMRQINAMKSEIQAARHRRQLSMAMQEFDEWNLLFESIRRKLKRLKTGISKKREMELLWENAGTILAEKQGNVMDEETERTSSIASETRSILVSQ
jgi:hypothetical protein